MLVKVAAFIALLKVALITWATGTAVAPLSGIVETTVGGTTTVVKVQT